jgi:pimeloyl-ACP methyl ester carboxylesterase/membrane protein DedA with SNARE-associated domain
MFSNEKTRLFLLKQIAGISRKNHQLNNKKLSQKSIFKRKRLWLALVYVSLLIWSGVYRSRLTEPPLPETKKTIQLSAYDGDIKLARRIRFAYQETAPTIQEDNLPVVLIHGSPGSAEVFDGLSKLIQNRRLISVDLPGFGNSEMDVPDYSISAHAKYLQEFLTQKNIGKAHFVGFSLGGGVILQFAGLAPERIASVSFIASIGVQEYELLGDYHINHLIHGVQLGFVWILQNLTPHFGIFDGVPYTYSRNFYDTDQRPLRKIMEDFDKPFQIIHGKNDPLVPVEAAREHKRIIPQSEYHELDDDHFFIFMRPEKTDELLKSFWEDVETGKAKTRPTAGKKRVAEANKPFDYQVLPVRGATVFIFFLLFLIIAFFNEDLAFLLAGIFIAQGRFGFTLAIVACLSGIILSICGWLLFGKFCGRRFSFFDKFADENIFTNRIFGFRFPIYFAYGKSHPGSRKYLFQFILAGIIWLSSLIFASYLLSYGISRLSILSLSNTFGLILGVLVIYLVTQFLLLRMSRES